MRKKPWTSEIWYFAHPYSAVGEHTEAKAEQLRNARFLLSSARAAQLAMLRYNVFSPISHSVPVQACLTDQMPWYDMDNGFIETGMFTGIILAPGWRESAGCVKEKELMEDMGGEVITYWEIIWQTMGKIGVPIIDLSDIQKIPAMQFPHDFAHESNTQEKAAVTIGSLLSEHRRNNLGKTLRNLCEEECLNWEIASKLERDMCVPESFVGDQVDWWLHAYQIPTHDPRWAMIHRLTVDKYR